MPFVHENLSSCRQHVYVSSQAKPSKKLPETDLKSAERVLKVNDQYALYLTKVRLDVILADPLEEGVLEFLWPFRLDIVRGCLVVRFVILEKNVSSYFAGRTAYIRKRSIEEETILGQITDNFKGDLHSTDLHKGLKALWKDDFMDATRTSYKKPMSIATEVMNEAKGIKKYNPELYAILMKSVLNNTLFQVEPNKKCSVSAFWADAANGRIYFPRYTDKGGDTEFVIDEILRNN
jgi:hypothetical protein